MTVTNFKSLQKIINGDTATRIKIFGNLSRRISYNPRRADDVALITALLSTVEECLHSGNRELIMWTCSFLHSSRLDNDAIWNWAKMITLREGELQTDDPHSIGRLGCSLAGILFPKYGSPEEILNVTLNHRHHYVRFDQYNNLRENSYGHSQYPVRHLKIGALSRMGVKESEPDLIAKYLDCIATYGDTFELKLETFELFANNEHAIARNIAQLAISYLITKNNVTGYKPKFPLDYLRKYDAEHARQFVANCT